MLALRVGAARALLEMAPRHAPDPQGRDDGSDEARAEQRPFERALAAAARLGADVAEIHVQLASLGFMKGGGREPGEAGNLTLIWPRDAS